MTKENKAMEVWGKGWNSLKMSKYLLYIVGTELGAG